MKKGFILSAALSVFFIACSKDEHRSMREEGIVSGSWKIKSRDTVELAKPGAIRSDSLSKIERATRYRFLRDGNLAQITANALDTVRANDSAITGKWLLQDADTKLLLTAPALAGNYDFLDYNDSVMVLQMLLNTGDTDSFRITTVLRRQ